MTDQVGKSTEEKEPRRKRKWLRFIVVLVVFLGILAVLINGPISRWIIKDRITAIAEEQKLYGDFTVEGTLLSGYTFSNIDFSGEGGVKSAQIKKLSVSYHLSGLFNRSIDSIELDSTTIILDIADFPESEEEEETDLKALAELIRPWALSPEISVKDLNITVLDKGELLAGVELGALEHIAHSDTIVVTDFVTKNDYAVALVPQTFTAQWLEGSAKLDKFTIFPRIEVLDSQIDWSGSLMGETTIRLGDALVGAKLKEDIELNLLQGEISSAKMTEWLGFKLPAAFSIEKLNVSIAEWSEQPEQWELDLALHASQLEYQEYKVSDLQIAATQQKAEYEVSVTGVMNQAPIKLKVDGEWSKVKAEGEKWWGNTKFDYQASISELGQLPELWLENFAEVDYEKAVFTVEGEAEVEELGVNNVSAYGSFSGLQIKEVVMPSLEFATSMNGSKVLAKIEAMRDGQSVIEFNGNYDLEQTEYEAKLSVKEANPYWMNTLLEYVDTEVKVASGVYMTWGGAGNVTDVIKDLEQQGELKLSPLKLELPDLAPIEVATELVYTFPEKVEVKFIDVKETDWQIKGGFSWDGSVVKMLPFKINNREKEIGKISGMIPFDLEIDSLETFFKQTELWEIDAYANPIAIDKFKEWFSIEIPEGIEAITDTSIKISGSPATPAVKGYTNVLKIKGLHPELKKELNTKVFFESTGQTLKVETSVLEGSEERLTANALLPFTPLEWIRSPDKIEPSLMSSKIEGSLNVRKFPLSRISNLVPELEKIEGSVSATGTFSGTVNEPKYQLDIVSEVPLLEINNDQIKQVKEIKLKSTVTEDLIVKNKLTAQINGGLFEIIGDVDINDPTNPKFDFGLNCKYALAYRNDFISSRLNAGIKLKGTLEDATISGEVGIVETLFYKDIELIPIGVPSSAVARVQLPSIQPVDADKLPIPEPFSNWKLDLVVKTEDPILIRGNVAKGSVRGSMRIKGTTALPEPDGSFYITNTKAKLPFSELVVKKGEVKFTPKTGLFNPELNIAGTSEVANHRINLLVHGNVSSPGTTLTSSPPLPEAEIMSLLGTGSSTSSLASSEAVALKAFQVFLQKMKDRQNTAAGNRLFKVLLTSMKDLNLQVGQADKFTGRKFTSATLEIAPKWHFTTQIDNQQESRWLLVYLINFK